MTRKAPIHAEAAIAKFGPTLKEVMRKLAGVDPEMTSLFIVAIHHDDPDNPEARAHSWGITINQTDFIQACDVIARSLLIEGRDRHPCDCEACLTSIELAVNIREILNGEPRRSVH